MANLICIHSSASNSRQWNALAAAGAPEHATIAPDLIGYGSDTRWNDGGSVTLDDEAARIDAIVDAARAPVILVGHSYGGAVALRVALRRHDRVAALVLYEPSLFSLIVRDADDDAAGGEIVSKAHAIRDDVRAGRIEQAARSFVDYWSGKGAWHAMDPRRQQGVCARMPKVVQEFAALFGDAVPLAAYARLSMPVLWLEGAMTCLPPRAVARRLLPALADVRHARVAGAGHMGPITHPDAVNAEILTFVRAVGCRGRVGLAA